mmetsp:Transcript_11321/g.21542  ORF Transcript_11321/g.21542 Transcript_11321/m.21542 type:complete len:230 (-) Transcript_11321:74-763(-)|eukprot:CAMPEP_0197446032 /NCGR_PEP_ID=MMETSP1175-20131217/11093_1 /TAXON_ID=1003142 /ORGANISM="Triceratium dubium, Strain CCMP147" /LENGTH=229 /DNA_ID=CAMNT_0042977091 /DNA_START=368 /DNA_END=1057 /DNA_ORIENTATION=+
MDPPTFAIVDDDVEEGTDLNLVLATDLRELLDLIEGECRALRSKGSFQRQGHNADGGSYSDGSSCSDSESADLTKPRTIAVGSIGGDDTIFRDKESDEVNEKSPSDDQLVNILEEIEDSCHKFRSFEEDSSSCSATAACLSFEDDSSDDETNSRDEKREDDNVGSLLAVACALRTGAEAWAKRERMKSQKQKKYRSLSKKAAAPSSHRTGPKLKGPRIRQCKPINPNEI